MSDVGKRQRPQAAEAELGKREDLPRSPLEEGAAGRRRVGEELAYRVSGGRRGVAPMQRIMDERRAIGAQLAGRVQRKANACASGGAVIPEGGGVALSSRQRQRFEPRLGADLSDVRLHTGDASTQAAANIGARAFTVENDVHFNSGEFAPGEKEGDRLLAHELTHVVQGRKSGVQRKAGEGADAHNADHDTAEVSHPEEPAEKEADAVADRVAHSLHGGKAHDKNAGDRETGAHAAAAGRDEADSAGHGAKDDGTARGQDDAHGADAQQGGASATAAPAEKPAPISAKYVGVGGKIFRARGGGPVSAPAPAPGGKPAPASAPPVASSSVPSLRTSQDVRRFCAPDPIAIQKLADVDAETNIDPAFGGPARAKQEFYQGVADYVNANPAVPANTIFNSCFEKAASNWKFKGTKISPAAISRVCSRTCGLTGWWYDAVKKAPFEAQARAALGPGADAGTVSKIAQDLWKARVKDGGNVMSTIDRSASIKPTGQTWYTPDKVQLKSGGDAGFAELMRINALQPEWFPEGTVSFEISPIAFAGEARKPTAYDGMQSALWVSRPDGDTFGVTGGSAKEFLARNVQCAGILSARATIPSGDMRGELQAAMKKAYDNALAMDPMLKQAIENEKDPKKREGLERLVPNLTDQVIRGDLSFGSLPKAIRDLIGDTVKTTALERSQPTKNKNPSGTGRRP